MTSGWIRALAAAASAPVMVVLLAAQEPSPSVADRKTVWTGVYTEAQAARGRSSYARSCERCHAAAAGGVARRFTGDAFWASWGEDRLESLYAVIRRSMPNDAPGSLPDATYADIVALFLESNGVPAGGAELTPDAVRSVWLTKRDGGGTVPDGAFVTVAGCLVKDEHGWRVDRSQPPRRARSADAVDANAIAAEAPGESTFRLLYLISNVDRFAGHKVLVRGLLVRQPADGVNVTTVQSVAASCGS